MKIAAIVLLITLASTSAQAEDLWLLGSNRKTVDFGDKDTLKTLPYNMRRIWVTRVMSDIKNPKTTGGYNKILYKVDCGEESLQTTSIISYDLSGNVKGSTDSPGQWLHVPPGSVSAAIIEFACGPDSYAADAHFAGGDPLKMAGYLFEAN